MKLTRRDFLALTAASVTLRCASSDNPPVISEPGFLLSATGASRATGYEESVKIVTRNDRTHVAWLDSPAEGFRVRVRTFDRGTQRWSSTYTVGEAYDNHGGPAMAIDDDGFLHIFYYPHQLPMRYRKSRRPNDASEWEDETRFGDQLTYPAVVCDAEGTLYMTARRRHVREPWHVELWVKRRGEEWRNGGVILQARDAGYSHFLSSLAWAPDGETLHLGCRFHENAREGGRGRQTVGYLCSRDRGATWQNGRGDVVALPATAETVDVVERGGEADGRILRAGAIAADAAGPIVVYSIEERGRASLVLARLTSGEWQRRNLSAFLPRALAGWSLTAPAAVTVTESGAIVVVAQLCHLREGEAAWAHPSTRVGAFCSRDGAKTFSFMEVSGDGRGIPRWLPNLERATGIRPVPDQPGVLWTAGGPGATNKELVSNGVRYIPIGCQTVFAS